MYYNTTHLTGELLEEANKLTSKQDKIIFGLFADNPGGYFSSHDVEDKLGKYPRSSIVRSMNTLTNRGLISKTNQQVTGKYGKLVYLWTLNRAPADQLPLL
jgi:predicted transcriptional regulator